MRTLGNILWLVLAGVRLAIGYVIAGILMCILIVTIPLGIQAFKLASFSLWPFGRTVVDRPDAPPALGCLGNVVWLVLGGLELAVAHPARARPLSRVPAPPPAAAPRSPPPAPCPRR